MSAWFTVPGMSLDEARQSRKSSHPSTSSAEGSLARTSRQPARVQGSPDSAAAYGLSISESFALFDRDGWSSRMLQLFGGGASEPFSGDWPTSGMMLSGRCYRRPPWAPRTFGGDSSSLRGYPTPTAADAKGVRSYGRGNPSLTAAVKYPSPRASDSRGPGPTDKQQGGPSLTVAVCYPTPSATPYGTNQGGGAGRVGTVRPGLDSMARHGLWPTMTVKGNHNRVGLTPTSGDGLATAAGGTLSPAWVELLMGFPHGYTEVSTPKPGNSE